MEKFEYVALDEERLLKLIEKADDSYCSAGSLDGYGHLFTKKSKSARRYTASRVVSNYNRPKFLGQIREAVLSFVGRSH
jgi:hypothetical protein